MQIMTGAPETRQRTVIRRKTPEREAQLTKTRQKHSKRCFKASWIHTGSHLHIANTHMCINTPRYYAGEPEGIQPFQQRSEKQPSESSVRASASEESQPNLAAITSSSTSSLKTLPCSTAHGSLGQLTEPALPPSSAGFTHLFPQIDIHSWRSSVSEGEPKGPWEWTHLGVLSSRRCWCSPTEASSLLSPDLFFHSRNSALKGS